MRFTLLIFLITVHGLLITFPSHAQQWSEFAYISQTLGVSDSRICIGEASRGEIGCPSFAPTISPTGRMNLTSGLTVDAISLTAAGTTWGYLGSTASYLPNLNSNAISATNISATTLNGLPIASLGDASPTNIPAFIAYKSGNQTIAASTWTKIIFNSEQFDNLNSYNPATGRFQPSIAGTYIVTANTYCTASASVCYLDVYKNGSSLPVEGGVNGARSLPNVATLLNLNGTTDYVEMYVFSDSTTIQAANSSFSGSLLASGNGLVSGTGATALSALTDVALASPVTGQILTYNGTSWVNSPPVITSVTTIYGTTTLFPNWPDAIECQGPSAQSYIFYTTAQNANGSVSYRYIANPTGGDLSFGFNSDGSSNGTLSSSYDCYNKSISQLYAEGRAFNFLGSTGTSLTDSLTSGTLAVTVNSSTAIISLTTNGTTWGYLSANGSYIPSVASNRVSATVVQLSNNPPNSCDNTALGTLKTINGKIFVCRQ